MSFNFSTGAEAAEEAGQRRSFAKSNVEFFKIEDEKENPKFVRFLTDRDPVFKDGKMVAFGWITVDMHMQVPTRPKPADYKGNWPDKMSAVCRKQVNPQNGELVFPQFGGECYICDLNLHDAKGRLQRPKKRTWAVGILREEAVGTIGPNGRPLLRDVLRPIVIDTPQGEAEVPAPVYEVFSFAWSNFWSPLEGVSSMYHTCCDRDYQIKRRGYGMNDTEYVFAAFDPVDWNPYQLGPDGKILVSPDGQPLVSATTERLDSRSPAFLAAYHDAPNVADQVFRQASDDYYDRFFDIRHPQPKWGGEDGASDQPAKPSNDAPTAPQQQAVVQQAVAPTEVASIASRLAGIPGVGSPVVGYGVQAQPQQAPQG